VSDKAKTEIEEDALPFSVSTSCLEAANFMGIRTVDPPLIHWGTEEQKKRYIPTILNGEEIRCQGYSDPGAGLDIASLQTRAEEPSGTLGERILGLPKG
jgi:alkylation response protein AidB-like acyl-CoA dehydrogenase